MGGVSVGHYLHGRTRDMFCRPVLLLKRPEVRRSAFPRQNARCLDRWFAVDFSFVERLKLRE
jgi:hypothetical protein